MTDNCTYTRSEQKSGDLKGEPLNKQPRYMTYLRLN